MLTHRFPGIDFGSDSARPLNIRARPFGCFPCTWLVFLTGLLLVRPDCEAQENPQAFVGGQILSLAGDEFENGVLVVQNGRITAVGSADTPIPENAERHDVSSKIIMPGLVDTHSHLGRVAGGDRSDPIQPEVRAYDAIDVRHPSLRRARAGGITTVNIMPGSGHLISGQTIYLKLRDGKTIEDLVITNAQGRIAGGLKMANGTNSRRDPPFPGTRGKSAALVREKFFAAQEYRSKVERGTEDPEKKPDRDLAMETLVEVLDGQRVVHFHTHRHDDIVTVLRLQEEFGFRVVLHHVSDAWKVTNEIAAADVPCSIILLDSPGGKLEARDIDWKNALVLEQAGVLTAFHSDDYINDSRLFLRSAGLAVRADMSREGALAGVTIAGAAMLDLRERVGSLEPGKDADFIILSGDPLSVYTDVLETWVEGKKVFDRDDPEDRLIATGGPGAGNPDTEPLCCYGTLEESR